MRWRNGASAPKMKADAPAPAKVNLSLHVTGRRADGLHEIDSLAVFAEAADMVEVDLSGPPGIEICGPMAAGVPGDGTNLALRAARLFGIGARIRIDKRLPAAAGLGGGTADAAAALRLLERLSGRPVPAEAATLGADMPLCLLGAAARARGIGERVAPVAGLPELEAVLASPNLPVPTEAAFARLDSRENPPMPDKIPAFASVPELAAWLRGMRNDLEGAAAALAPASVQVREALGAQTGCLLARMSGSGAAAFGIFDGAAAAAAAAAGLAAAHPGWWVEATRLNPRRADQLTRDAT